MFGCASDARMLRSRAMRSANVAPPQLMCGSFNATWRSSRPSARSASQTVAMPPWPISRSNLYGPTTPSLPGGGGRGSLARAEIAGVCMKSPVLCAAWACSSCASRGESRAWSGARLTSQPACEAGSRSSAVSSSARASCQSRRDAVEATTSGAGRFNKLGGAAAQRRRACRNRRAFSQSRATVRTPTSRTPAISVSVMPAK